MLLLRRTKHLLYVGYQLRRKIECSNKEKHLLL